MLSKREVKNLLKEKNKHNEFLFKEEKWYYEKR